MLVLGRQLSASTLRLIQHKIRQSLTCDGRRCCCWCSLLLFHCWGGDWELFTSNAVLIFALVAQQHRLKTTFSCDQSINHFVVVDDAVLRRHETSPEIHFHGQHKFRRTSNKSTHEIDLLKLDFVTSSLIDCVHDNEIIFLRHATPSTPIIYSQNAP